MSKSQIAILAACFGCLIIILVFNKPNKEKGRFRAIKSSISEYMSQNLNDYGSYSPVETIVDSSYGSLSFKDDAVRLARLKSMKDSIWLHFRDQPSELALDSIRSRKNKEAGPVFSGYVVTHSFRANNYYGGKVKSTLQFYLDTLFRIKDVRKIE